MNKNIREITKTINHSKAYPKKYFIFVNFSREALIQLTAHLYILGKSNMPVKRVRAPWRIEKLAENRGKLFKIDSRIRVIIF